jgi:hypothetical protein
MVSAFKEKGKNATVQSRRERRMGYSLSCEWPIFAQYDVYDQRVLGASRRVNQFSCRVSLMTLKRTITFRIPEPLFTSAVRAARAEEMTASEFIRAAVAERVAEFDDQSNRDAASTLRRGLRRDFTEARDWVDLQHRLRERGFVLRDRNGELALMSWPVERRLMPLARLGLTRDELTILYRAPFPAHGPGASAHGARAKTPLLLVQPTAPAPKAKPLPFLLMRPLETAA